MAEVPGDGGGNSIRVGINRVVSDRCLALRKSASDFAISPARNSAKLSASETTESLPSINLFRLLRHHGRQICIAIALCKRNRVRGDVEVHGYGPKRIATARRSSQCGNRGFQELR